MESISYPFDADFLLKKKKSLKRQFLQQDNLPEKRIAILSGSTIGDIQDILEIFLLSYGIKPLFYAGEYNRFYEDAVFENKELSGFKPDIIYIHTSFRNLSEDGLFEKLRATWEKINENYKCAIIQNNFELPAYNFSDNCKTINALNLEIYDYAQKNKDFHVNDIQYLSAFLGLEKWFDDQNYYLYKYALSIRAIPLLCHNIAKIIKSIYGKNQKCLVLDLDNTLWGGVAGEVGPLGVELGMETALGEAYINFQKYVMRLHEIGIILAVCSKNDEKTAKEVFSNPNMVLRLDDIAVFCANWKNKAENIAEIARKLNILPDSMVFVDDNPAERALVKTALPQVKVVETDSVMDFARFINEAGYFDTVNISEDDVKRNEYYNADAKRAQAKLGFENYGEYLQSLQMSSAICPFSTVHLDRITQLVNKTNQFNLTTKRYNLSDIEQITNNNNYISLYATLDDKFGSNGIVSALIGEIAGKVLHIRLWVMSCRVFKRDLELAVFDHLIEICKDMRLEKLIGYYIETEKNAFVSSLLPDLGFYKSTDGTWTFDVITEYQNKNKYIHIKKD